MTDPPRFCTSCGRPLGPAARFCTDCGASTAPAPYAAAAMPGGFTPFACEHCGGDGARLPASTAYCYYCRWLRPLGPGYELDVDAFMWRLDADAMAVLRSLGPLSQAAQSISERFGRPVFEAAANGVRLSERQMPEVFGIAVQAGRLLGVSHLPEVYVSGERMWDAYTLGGDAGSFIAIGSVLTNFKPEDLLFVLCREMGHVRAGHVYWRTALEFLFGQKRPQSTILGEGALQFLNPFKIMETAVEAPLMAWSRHAEITADRAGLLATGRADVARRVVTQWTLKSFPVYAKIDQDAWRQQEDASDDPMLRMSEWTMSTQPYLAPRLKVLRDFMESEEYRGWRPVIAHWATAAGIGRAAAPPPAPRAADDSVRVVCPACGKALRVPKAPFAAGRPVNVRCPNTACRKVLTIKPPAAPAPPPAETVRILCAACREPMRVKRAALAGPGPVHVRCPNPACGKVLTVRPAAARDDTVRLVCVACREPMRVARARLAGPGPVHVRCPNPACGKVLTVRPAVPPPDQLTPG